MKYLMKQSVARRNLLSAVPGIASWRGCLYGLSITLLGTRHAYAVANSAHVLCTIPTAFGVVFVALAIGLVVTLWRPTWAMAGIVGAGMALPFVVAALKTCSVP